MHLLKSFNRGRSGNVAIYLAVIALPLLFAANFSLDYMNASRARESLQALADAVALAAVRVLPDEQAAREEAARIYNAGIAEISTGLVSSDMTLDLIFNPDFKAHAEISGTIKSATGLEFSTSTDFFVEADATVANVRLEIAVTTDLSGSMRTGGKIQALRRALESFTSDVFSVKSANLDVAMAVVPFNGSVLLPAYAANWRLGSREGREGTRESSASRQETGAAVAACATTRNGVWDMTNRTPAEQRFDRVDANTPICPDQELRALTSNRADLINFARGLQEKSGGTANHIAASWAYRILSPKWADFWPAGSASQKTAVKIALLMTDGENAKYGGLLDPDADDLMLEACQNMKADGIEIYAIAFQTPLSVRPLLEQCASSADDVYSAGSNAQLESAFEAIAQEALSKRMIKLVN